MELVCRDRAAELDRADSRARKNGCDERPRRKERRWPRSRDESSAHDGEPTSLAAVATPKGELAALPPLPSDRDADASHDCHGVFARGVMTTLVAGGGMRADRDGVKRERPPSLATMVAHGGRGAGGKEEARGQVDRNTGRPPSVDGDRRRRPPSLAVARAWTADATKHKQPPPSRQQVTPATVSRPAILARPCRHSAQPKQPCARRGQQAGAASRAQPVVFCRSQWEPPYRQP